MAFDWEAYKKEILYLYLREGLTLERIRQKLIDKYQEFNPRWAMSHVLSDV